MAVGPALYCLTLSAGDEASAAFFCDALIAHLEARGTADAVTIGCHDAGAERWRVEVIGAELPGLATIRAAAREAFGDPVGFPPVSVARLANIDWVAHSQRGLSPVHAGAFVVYGSHDGGRFRGRRLGILIDAGEAFGTAHHGTTQGCLIALDWLARLKRIRNVLDIGAGTGVLAIAAAKRGARVLATDIDPAAVRVARDNVALNGVGIAVTCIQADGLRAHPIRDRAPYDLIFANILAEPLMAMANGMRRVAGSDGIIVLSGVLGGQAWRVLGRFGAAGFTLRRRIDLQGWATLVMSSRCDIKCACETWNPLASRTS